MAKATLQVEQLEDRMAPATFNVPWPEADAMTISFAPDGTLVGNQPSALFQTLNSQFATSAWELQILRAFQTWAVQADINVGLVTDGGQPFGTLGLKQGDPRFGDIRIGAFPMGDDVLAVANPYDPFVANTFVGDVFINSSDQFSLGGQLAPPDLFSVMLHEAGHVFGIGPSSDPNSPMFEQFHDVQSLTPADIAALQALYGPRPPDSFEGPTGNNTLASATPLSLTDSTGMPASALIQADVTTLTDADVYKVVVPAGVQSLDVQLQAAGISLLVPKLTIYDAAGNVINTSQATSPLSNNLSFNLDHVAPGDTFYVKVESGESDVFGIGSYQLAINPQPTSPATSHAITPPLGRTPGLSVANIHLLATIPGYVEHTYYEADDNLSPATPVHTYRVLSANLGPDMTNVMTVEASAEVGPDPQFQINVFDDQGNLVPARTIADSDGNLEVQILGVHSNQDYFVQISGNSISDQGTVFEVTVDFSLDATHLTPFVNDSVPPGQQEVLRTLQVNESQLFHFALSATDFSAPVPTGAQMMIVDDTGQTVFTMTVQDGATRSGNIFLNEGTYTVRFTRANVQSNELLVFELNGLSLSDAIGPQLRDTTTDPVDSSASNSQLSFFWLPYNPANVTLRAAGDAIRIALAPYLSSAFNIGSSLLLVPAPANSDTSGSTIGPVSDNSSAPASPFSPSAPLIRLVASAQPTDETGSLGLDAPLDPAESDWTETEEVFATPFQDTCDPAASSTLTRCVSDG